MDSLEQRLSTVDKKLSQISNLPLDEVNRKLKEMKRDSRGVIQVLSKEEIDQIDKNTNRVEGDGEDSTLFDKRKETSRWKKTTTFSSSKPSASTTERTFKMEDLKMNYDTPSPSLDRTKEDFTYETSRTPTTTNKKTLEFSSYLKSLRSPSTSSSSVAGVVGSTMDNGSAYESVLNDFREMNRRVDSMSSKMSSLSDNSVQSPKVTFDTNHSSSSTPSISYKLSSEQQNGSNKKEKNFYTSGKNFSFSRLTPLRRYDRQEEASASPLFFPPSFQEKFTSTHRRSQTFSEPRTQRSNFTAKFHKEEREEEQEQERRSAAEAINSGKRTEVEDMGAWYNLPPKSPEMMKSSASKRLFTTPSKPSSSSSPRVSDTSCSSSLFAWPKVTLDCFRRLKMRFDSH